MRYRKKPVEVDAIQWTGKNREEVREFCGMFCLYHPERKELGVMTERGPVGVENGMWIVKGGRGLFPMRDADFLEFYEPVANLQNATPDGVES